MSQSNSYKKNINKFTTNIFGDTYLPSVNGKKFEEIAYSTYFDIEILSQLSQEFTFYIFVGSDSGMLLTHLKQLNISPSSFYLFIEAREIQSQLNKYKLKKEELNKKQSNIIISTIDDWQDEVKKSDIIKYLEVDRVQVIKSFSAQDQTYSAYLSIAQKLHDEINQLKWNHPDKFQKKIYIQRQIENCADNINPAIKLKGLLKGKPALILAGGPSLDNYINWIEENQQYYVIIAVSRIARRLLSTKIVPDIFVTADPYESAYTSGKEVLAYGEKSILISQNYAHPRLIGQWQGQHFYLGEVLPWETNYKPENIKAIGPTVANCAIHIAIQMGMINQILFGVDLCYSDSGFTHVSSTDEYEQGSNLGFTGVSIKKNNNNNADTTYELSEARTSISLLAEFSSLQGGQIINPSPDSAKINNVHYQSLDNITIPADLIDGYSLVMNQLETPEPEKLISHYSKLLEEHNQRIKEAKKILFISKEIVNLCSAQQNKDIDQLNHINKLEQKLKPYAKIINIIELFGINGYFNFIHPNKINSPDDRSIITEHYYTSLHIACDSFTCFLNNSIQRVECRSAEVSTVKQYKKIDIKAIAEGWERDKQYGRMILLFNKNYYLYEQLSLKVQKEYENNFNKIYNLSHKKKSSQQKTIIRLEDTEKKLYDSFQNKDISHLSLLIKQISKKNNENNIALAHLGQGYLYELENKTDMAINEYLSASSEQTLESSLKRILSITLNQGDIENSIAVLKALSDISQDYLIQLAELYQLSEQYKDALDTYSQYIDTNPEDILILIKIGLMYLSMDVIDGAVFIFEHILEITPRNQTSNIYLSKIKNLESSPSQQILYLNKIIYQPSNSLRFNEYCFFQTTNNKVLDIERLKYSERRNTIGFIATRQNIKNNIFVNYIKELYQKFETVNFVIFFFDTDVKQELSNILDYKTSRIKFIKPNNLYDIVENIEIYINYGDINNNHLMSKIGSIIINYCWNIYFITFKTEFIEETFESNSQRNVNGIIMKNLKKLGFSKQDITDGENQYLKILYSKALNINDFRYKKDDLVYFKTIELSLKHKSFIHFSHELAHKIRSLK